MQQLIDSTAIDQWFLGKRRDAQGLLPHLVRKLINATVQPGSLSLLRIPVGDDVGRPGFDGEVIVNAPTEYVPVGVSVWEMGTSADPKTKADNDYNARLKDASLDKSFIFVTPHPWDGAADWRIKRNTEGKWKEVRVLDNVELAAWLEAAPAVSRWLARAIGIPAEGLRDLELFMGEFQGAFGIDISDDLIISGRTEAVSTLHEWFRGSEMTIRVEGQSADEAAAFIAAAVRKLPPDQAELISSRLVFVDTPESLEFLASLSSMHFVIPTNGDAVKRARAIHSPALRILIPGAPTLAIAKVKSESLHLGSIRRRACEDALKAMGLPLQRAQRIAVECKGMFNAVLWMIASDLDTPLPWTIGVIAAELAPLVLAGQWNPDLAGDREIIEKLSGKPYSEVEKTLAACQAPSGPLIRRGGIWDWLAWDFAWLSLARAIDSSTIGRFREVTKLVLSTRDPSLELEPSQRFAAALYGKTHPYSPVLRSGLISSIIQFALNDQHAAGSSGQAIASGIVSELLGGEGSVRRDAWLTLYAWLPDLAEAAPEAFLRSVRDLRSEPEAASAMFQGADMFGPNPHVHLLWALERIAWSKDFLTAAATELAELEAIDPGGSLMNRPHRSLINIFKPWYPQTSADVARRIDAIDVIFRLQPDIAWTVAVSLLPASHDTASPTASPEWRNWKPEQDAAPTVQDYWEFVELLIQRMLGWASAKPSRWNDLLKEYIQLEKGQPELAANLLAALQSINANSIPNEVRIALTTTARESLTWQLEMAEEESASEEIQAQLRTLEVLKSKFEPTDPPLKHQWLFEGWPRLPGWKLATSEEQNQQLNAFRLEAVKDIFQMYELQGVIIFAKTVERPDIVGFITAEINLDPSSEAELLTTALSITPEKDKMEPIMQFGIGYVSGAMRRFGQSWIERVTAQAAIGWNSNMYANLAWGLPPNAETWDLVEALGMEVSDLYWHRTPIHFISDSNSDGERAIRNLLESNRPYRAIYLADLLLSQEKQKQAGHAKKLPKDLIRAVLQEAPRQNPGTEWFSPGINNIGYHVENLIDALEAADEEPSVLGTIEWAWMPAIARGRRGLKTLNKVLSTEPELYVDVLRTIFRGDGEEVREVTDDLRSRATQAHTLLRQWHEVPGASYDSPPNETTVNNPGSENGDISFATGKVDEPKLTDWVIKARNLAEKTGHLDHCNLHLGEVLAYAPADASGLWPCAGVRAFIENIANERVERGIGIGVYNRRGTHSRQPGGDQERRLASKFRHFAEAAVSKWPRTGAILFSIADHYEAEGKHQDSRTEFEEFED